jgi:N-acetylmuramoyl-L-alanine amidase
MNRSIILACAAICLLLGACARPGDEIKRRGDEIMVCGRLFHTGAPVVLWTDPGGYDAYRTEKRFVPWARAAWMPPDKSDAAPASPNRYGVRFAPKLDQNRTSQGELTDEEFERIRGGGWDLDLLRRHVDQLVLHYDVCGVSRQCFRVLHDVRGLSVHFMLDIDGTIYQTMDLKDRAWHATISNDRSVGVEIANIGAYPPAEKSPLDQWYATETVSEISEPGSAVTRTRITVPPRLGDGGVRTPGFIGYAARPDSVAGVIQGRELRQYDFTPQQYRSLIRLAAALHKALPRIDLDYPRDAHGDLVTQRLSPADLAMFHGVLGHYHIQADKSDPGPALRWDVVINGARRMLGMPVLPTGDRINTPGTQPAVDSPRAGVR